MADLQLFALGAPLNVPTQNKRFLKVSRLKTPSREDTTRIELQSSIELVLAPVCSVPNVTPSLLLGVAFFHEPGVDAAWSVQAACNYDVYFLPTTGGKFHGLLFNSRAKCASEPSLAPQAVCVWIR